MNNDTFDLLGRFLGNRRTADECLKEIQEPVENVIRGLQVAFVLQHTDPFAAIVQFFAALQQWPMTDLNQKVVDFAHESDRMLRPATTALSGFRSDLQKILESENFKLRDIGEPATEHTVLLGIAIRGIFRHPVSYWKAVHAASQNQNAGNAQCGIAASAVAGGIRTFISKQVPYLVEERLKKLLLAPAPEPPS